MFGDSISLRCKTTVIFSPDVTCMSVVEIGLSVVIVPIMFGKF